MKIYSKLLIIGFLVCFAFLWQTVNPLSAYATVNCSGGNCWFTACRINSDCGTNQYTGAPTCQGNSVWQNYMTYTCVNPGSADSYCTTTVAPRNQMTCSGNQYCKAGICFGETVGSGGSVNYPYSYNYNNNNPYTCNPYSSRKCVGNSVYWFDSCNNQQALYQNCYQGQTCSNGVCENSQLNYNPRALKGCENNTVYWYDSLGSRQDVYQSCSSSQTCQNGQCVGTIITQASQAPYAKHYATKCYNNDVYWYDSRGVVQDLYKNCQDNNQCTVDSCKNAQCTNELKCDGSACLVDSNDYGKYCLEAKTTAALSEGLSLRDLWGKWYIWIIIAAVLIILFIVIFRRLSSKV